MKQIRKMLSVAAAVIIALGFFVCIPEQASAACASGYIFNSARHLCINLRTGASYNPGGIDPGLFNILKFSSPSQITLSQLLNETSQTADVYQLNLDLTAADLAALGVSDISQLVNQLNGLPSLAGWSASAGATQYALMLTRPGQPVSVPEPSTILLLGAGLFGLAGFWIMRRKKIAAK